jgi:small conductance mechanosensitive channel
MSSARRIDVVGDSHHRDAVTRRRATASGRQATPAARRAPTRRRPPPGAMPRSRDPRLYQQQARSQLRRFRQGSALAVAVTGLLLLVWGAPVPLGGQEPAEQPTETTARPGDLMPTDPAAAVDQAAATMRELAYGFYAFTPRLVLVLGLFAIATIVARAVQALLNRTLRGWERKEAAGAIAKLLVYFVVIVAAVSVLAGDSRAVVGSVGLLGLAASWALQTPIESFTGWLLNSFRGYYRVGDRIAVGDVFGDVYRIDVLTTTVWEAGGVGKPVRAAQSTGALITFPNWEVLRSNVVNYSRDFPYVWDEVTFNVANESDLRYTAQVIEKTARRILGPQMEDAAARYQALLQEQRLGFDVDEVPRVYFSLADAWTDCTLRYLVPVRTRRKWVSILTLEVSSEIAKPEHHPRILSVYPRTEILLRRSWPTAEPPAGE